MLGKLIKYDFKWVNKVMYIYFVILFIISISVRIVESMDQTFLLVIIDKILSGMFIGCFISVIITCLMRIWARFLCNFYKDESYLTHTLPITKKQLFNSKVISSALSILLSALVVIICVAIVYLNKDTIETIKYMFNSLFDVYGKVGGISFVVGLVLLVIFELLYLMMAGMFGIVLGHRFNNSKMLKSILISIASYGVLSVISFIALAIITNITGVSMVTNGFPSLNTLKAIGLPFIIIYFIYNLGYYLLTKRIFNKGVNVE